MELTQQISMLTLFILTNYLYVKQRLPVLALISVNSVSNVDTR